MSTADRRDEAMRTLEHEIGMLLRRVRKGIGERAVKVHPDLNPTSYTLLMTLVDFGPRRAAELADLFALDKGAVSRVVHQLLELGYVERTPDPHDGRASIVAATASAVKRLDEVAVDRRVEFGQRLAEWEPTEIDDLARSLARFNETLSS